MGPVWVPTPSLLGEKPTQPAVFDERPVGWELSRYTRSVIRAWYVSGPYSRPTSP
jgi:hypothetical protein